MTSLWDATLPEHLTASLGRRLEGETHADVAIVGAGYTGLWTAYYLQQADPTLSIALVEAEHAGFGASGRNGGWASALFPASMTAITRRYGRDQAIAQQHAMHDTVDEILRISQREDWDIQAAKGGTIVAARTPVQVQRARDEIQMWRSFGFGESDYAFLDAEAARERIGATDVLCATYTPHCSAIHPARLVRSLAATVVSRGARLFEQSPVRSLEPGIIRTEHGSVRAPIVVRSLEGYTPTIPGYRRTLAPVYSLMIATEPLDAATWANLGLAERETFADYRHLIIYGQRTADNRLAFGGRGAPYHFGSAIAAGNDRDPDVFAELWRTLVDLFPAISGSSVTHAWGGPLGIPRDWFASCGLDRSTGLAWSGGYVGDGVGTSHLGGRTLAELITEQDTERTRLPWVNHASPRWEPEPLRWIGVNAGLRAMTSADDSEARTGKASRRATWMSRLLGA
jgi:glycine/D-amino acid oxidase-like deaminating enzyme